MDTMTDKYGRRFSRHIAAMFVKLWQINFFKKSSRFWFNTLRAQLRSDRTRRNNSRQGIQVPPVMVFSITEKCNLNCRGCYVKARNSDNQCELSPGRIAELFTEASELGTGIIMIAGGEPLMRGDVLEAAAKNRNTLFPVFTNGTLLRNGKIDMFSSNRNLVPVLSLEGELQKTDYRRGPGVYERVVNAAIELKQRDIFYGISITLDRNNFEEVMSPDFINTYFEMGSRLFFFVEYVPSGENDKNKCLTAEQKSRLNSRITNLRLVFPSLFIALPGEEEKYGGCLAAGRGFLHLSSTGDLEPCPFAPYSDINVSGIKLADGLRSGFLKEIRSKHHLLTESEGGCSLWNSRKWTESILSKNPDEKHAAFKKGEASQIKA